MTRTEENLVTSLENRVRALTKTVEDQQDVLEQQSVLLDIRTRQVLYLEAAVELLSRPRTTEAEMQRVADQLTILLREKEQIH